MCAYVCLCIFICLELFHVSFRDLHPPNSSSRLLITKILRYLVSCHYFSLSFPGCCLLAALLQKLTAAVYYWSTLTSISAYKGMSHQNTVLEIFTHTNTLLHKWQKNRHTPYAFFSTSCWFFFVITMVTPPSLNDRNKTKGTEDKERGSLNLNQPSRLLLLCLFFPGTFLLCLLCHTS